MEPPAAAPRMSLGARLGNIIAAPSEVFEAIAQSPATIVNWLVPSLLVAIAGLILNLVIFSQPALVQQIRDMQDEGFQKAVEAGKMTSQQADQARTVMEGIGMTIAQVAAGIIGVLAAFITPIWWAFILWLTARVVFRTRLPYLRMMEIAGLAGLVIALGMLVAMFMAMGTGRLFVGPHLGAFIEKFDLTNRGHIALGVLNLFGIWQLVLLALGFGKLLQRPFTSALLVLGGIWIGYKALAILLGLGQWVL